MYWASTTVIGRLECTTKFSPPLVKILNEVYSLVHLSRIACLTFLTGTFLGFEILFAKLLIMNYCFLFLCHFTIAGMEGVEPSLSMMYFYGVTYTKAFSLQALTTELRSPSRASTRSTVSTACEASPFRLKVRKAQYHFQDISHFPSSSSTNPSKRPLMRGRRASSSSLKNSSFVRPIFLPFLV